MTAKKSSIWLVEAGPLAQLLELRWHASTASARAFASVPDHTTGEVVSLLGSMAAQRFSWAAPAQKMALSPSIPTATRATISSQRVPIMGVLQPMLNGASSPQPRLPAKGLRDREEHPVSGARSAPRRIGTASRAHP